MSFDVLPLLIAALLWIGVEAPQVDKVELLLGGEHEFTDLRGAVIVADAEVAVPPDAEVSGPVYLIGGRTRIEGSVDGDVVQLAGTLRVGAGATITERLQHVSGVQSVSDGAAVAHRRSLQPGPAVGGPATGYGLLALLTVALAMLGGRRAHRHPEAVGNIGAAVVGHPLVSLTVGTLTGLTFLALFVFMAFTLILLPVAIAGLVAGLVAVGHGIIGLGALVGQRLGPRVGIARAGLATAAGIAVVMVLLELLAALPLVGALMALALLLTGLGAVLITYFGWKEFTPVALPD